MQLEDLERFAAVVEAGSFTAAAAILAESPRQLSRRVARLEAELGVVLFHRTTRSLRPTAEGNRWYADVRPALDRIQDATDAIRPGASVRGRVRVQVPTLLIDEALAWCRGALGDHPELDIDLLVGDRSDDLLGRGIDVCLSGVAPSGATVRVRRLGRTRAWLCAHRSYIDAHGQPRSPDELIDHACLRFVGAGTTLQRHWRLSHDDGRTVEAPVGGRLACNDSRTLLTALVSGLGIGPLTAVLGSGADASLVRVLDGWTFSGADLYLAFAPGRGRRVAVRFVADALTALTRQVIFGLQPSDLSPDSVRR